MSFFFRTRSTETPRFPEVAGTTLDGNEFVLPRDLHAAWNLLVVRFRDDLDPLADQWVLLARRLAADSEGRLAAYELPIVGKGFKVFRPLVHETLRLRADDANEQARTIPVYEDANRFSKRLGVRDKDTVHVFLVAPDGRIAWQDEGVLTPDKIAGLEEAVGASLEGAFPAEAAPAPEDEAPA